MSAYLRGEYWDEAMRDCSTEQAWLLLKQRVETAVSRFVPQKRRRNHNKLPWLSRDILRTIRRKKKLWS
jgi:hypothetical protein